VIKSSSASTIMGLERELKDAAAALQRCDPTSISLKAGCELFLRYTTRTSALEIEDFAAAKARLIEVGCGMEGMCGGRFEVCSHCGLCVLA
jgi:translation initiation factor eIF-2B subunit alpha